MDHPIAIYFLQNYISLNNHAHFTIITLRRNFSNKHLRPRRRESIFMSCSEINVVNGGGGNSRILRRRSVKKLHSNALARIDASYIQAYRLTSWELNRDSLWKRGETERKNKREREREGERQIKQPSTFFFSFFFFFFFFLFHSPTQRIRL